MSRHLTHRFWVSTWIAFVCLLASVTGREPAFAAIGAPFALLVAASALGRWWPAPTRVDVTIEQPRAIEGDEVSILIGVDADRSVPWLEFELQLAPTLEPIDPIHVTTSVAAGQTLERRIRVRTTRFGLTGPEWLRVTSRDLFGLTEVVAHYPLEPALRVHPPTERLLGLVPLHRVRTTTGEHRSRHRGDGTELAEVRPYRSGDPARRVHSRLSARRGRPMVLERHPDRSADAVIYLDSVQDIGADLETTLRWTVAAASALSRRHLRAMDRVGMLDRGAGVRWLPPTLGRRALHDIVEVLLRTTTLSKRTVDFLVPPHQLIPPDATVFAISPLLSNVVLNDLQRLRRRGHEVIVIEPEIPVPEGTSIRARRIQRLELEARRVRLAHDGIATIPWAQGDALEQTLRRAEPTIRRLATIRTKTASR